MASQVPTRKKVLRAARALGLERNGALQTSECGGGVCLGSQVFRWSSDGEFRMQKLVSGINTMYPKAEAKFKITQFDGGIQLLVLSFRFHNPVA